MAVRRLHRAAIGLVLAVAAVPGACAGAPSPLQVSPAPTDMSVNVGGGFWSPRLRAVSDALGKCAEGARSPAAPPSGTPTERALFDALASLSLEGAAWQGNVPATCASSCVRPEWNGADARGCGALATLASLRDTVWRVDGGDVPTVTVAIIADSELSFTVGDVRWNIDQGTDYPWSNHVGFTLSQRTSQPADAAEPAGATGPAGAPRPAGATGPADAPRPAGATGPAGATEPAAIERALNLRVQLPDWVDPASARVSARGRMLAASDFTVEGRTLTVRGPWSDGDRMHISFPMRPRRVPADGGVEIWRGPLRYVAEAADQPGSALADTTIAPDDGMREVPYVLGAVVTGATAVRQGDQGVGRGDPAAVQGDPVTQRPTPQPDAAANSAPNGIMAVMVERRARGLPDLVLVPLAFAGNRGDMPRVGTFAAPAP